MPKHETLPLLRRKLGLLPWWAALVLAPVLYGTLVAIPNLVKFEAPFFVGLDVLVRAAPQAAPIAGLLMLALAAFNGETEWQRAKAKRTSVAHLLQMSAHEVEQLVAEGFRQQSYVVEMSSAGPRLRKDGRVYVLNTKLWREGVVGIGPVRDLHQTATTEMADGAVLVTTGTFTADAQAFAMLHHMTLLSGDDLAQLVKDIHLDI